jgi:hypothetical protein
MNKGHEAEMTSPPRKPSTVAVYILRANHTYFQLFNRGMPGDVKERPAP